MGLRPYQQEALTKVKGAYDAGRRRLLAALATGTGKTVIFSQIPKVLGAEKKWLVIVHREELASQAAEKMRHWNPDLRVDIDMGSRVADLGSDVIVASVQTLGRTGSQRLARYNPADFAGVVVDEAHHSTAQSYKNVFQHFGLLGPGTGSHLLLGVTATPYRADGETLSDIYTEMAYEFPMLEAVEQGWLSPPKGIKLQTKTNLDAVKVRAGDFAQDELQNAVNTDYRNELIVKGWLDHAWTRQTIVFCVDIQHAIDLAKLFRQYNIPADAVWGVDPQREEKLAAHRAQKIRVLCNANVLTEGYDDWRIGCVVTARPTKSQLLFVQQVGRGTRLDESVDNLLEAKKLGKKLDKEDCLILDVVDNTSRHSLITLPAVVGLNPKMDLRGESVVAVKKRIDQLQQQNPNADLTKVTDVQQLETIAEDVDLFQVRFPEEVSKESSLQWHKTADGAYVLYVSQNEGVRIWEDLLGHWSYHLHIGKTDHIENGFLTRRDAFRWAEKMTKLAHPSWYLLRREADWHGTPATRPQLNLLARLGIKYPPTITKGDATKLITQYKANKFGMRG